MKFANRLLSVLAKDSSHPFPSYHNMSQVDFYKITAGLLPLPMTTRGQCWIDVREVELVHYKAVSRAWSRRGEIYSQIWYGSSM